MSSVQAEIEYPSSDGQPMSENTIQWNCMVTIKEGLEDLYSDRPDVFVAGDHLWYPVEGRVDIRMAPDAYVVFGRPKGHRGSYVQHREAGVPLHVVFEVLSPGNRRKEMQAKFEFYEKYGVEEYYIYDPDRLKWSGYTRKDERLASINDMANWTSPRLGIRFDTISTEMRLYRPDGLPFLSYLEQAQTSRVWKAKATQAQDQADAAQEHLEGERQRAETERQRAEAEKERADAEKQRADALAAKLRALGIEP